MLEDTASPAVTSSHDDVDVMCDDINTTKPVNAAADGDVLMAPATDNADVSSTSSVEGVDHDELVTSPAAAGALVRPSTGPRSECKVCGDDAAGMYFGALVCVPCKTFFLRYASDSRKFLCKYAGHCDVTVATRTHCKCCRFEKCLSAGMRRRVRPTHVQIAEGQQLCAICSDIGNGIHFGVITCEGCKKFFRRGLVEYMSYRCKNEGQCLINPQTRNLCRFCRFQKCITAGMSRNAIQMGRPTKYSAAAGGTFAPVPTTGVGLTLNFAGANQFGCTTLTPWFTTSPNLKFLLQQQSLVQHLSLHGAAWLLTAPCVSASPDSTVTELEQTSTDRSDRQEPVNLCRKSNASRQPQNAPSSQQLSSLVSATTSVSSAGSGMIMKVAEGRHLSQQGGMSVTSDEALDMSAKPVGVQLHSLQQTAAAMTSFPRVDGDVKPSAESLSVDHCPAIDIDRALSTSLKYWLRLSLNDIDDSFIGHHWDVINAIVPAYDKFVHHGTCLNRTLREEFEELKTVTSDLTTVLPVWIKDKVIPAYTVASVSYFQSLPGFKSFDADDQAAVIRLGQSASRVVLAAVHWYDVDLKLFRNFLSWRSTSLLTSSVMDLFKSQLIEYAESISRLQLDPIEAALLNALLVIATDYPDLKNASAIEEMHIKIVSALRAYTAAKYGTCSSRLKLIFSCLPYARRLGLLHYEMTRTRSVSAEEVVFKSTSPAALLSAASATQQSSHIAVCLQPPGAPVPL